MNTQMSNLSISGQPPRGSGQPPMVSQYCHKISLQVQVGLIHFIVWVFIAPVIFTLHLITNYEAQSVLLFHYKFSAFLLYFILLLYVLNTIIIINFV